MLPHEEFVMNLDLPRLTSQGVELDLAPERFGTLRRSDAARENMEELRARMEEDGYLFLPGYLDRDEVAAARRVMLQQLVREGALNLDYPMEDGVAAADAHIGFNPELHNDLLHRVVYDGAMMDFWARFFGEPVRHFDFTWIRSVLPGNGTAPHCDSVYMGRGTTDLFTAWTPLGDTSLEMGGLMVLEGSHRHRKLRENYSSKDVDAFCSNKRGDNWQQMGGGGNIRAGGWLSSQPAKLRDRLGGKWLTNEFRMGDLLVFSIYTVHASLDNQSDKIRLSSDTRYQRASEPADERWIGANPIAHGPAAKRGMIC
jgi:ectoine hydroxylase-related dioxygenase (phytanoyl-CoA dioxygenase family)